MAGHALKQHTKAVHDATNKLFTRADCEANSQMNMPLKQHAKAVHQNKTKTFKCRQCGKGFESGAQLDGHIVQCTRN